MTDAPRFLALPDLASERLGARALFANDEFFAPKESLLKESPAVFVPERYTDRGKWMDGWETRRRREPGHDWCVVKLGVPGILWGVVVDTAHFKGNHPEACSVHATHADGDPTAGQLEDPALDWIELLPRTPLAGDARNVFEVSPQLRFTHVRLSIHPDGGVARLRVHGEPLVQWGALALGKAMVELACADRGGRVVACSDMFFASPKNLILPGPSRSMPDGWETRRRRGAGHDWVIVRLGVRGSVRRVEIDTSHFKGNAPGSCALEGLVAGPEVLAPPAGAAWSELLPRAPLRPHALHAFDRELEGTSEVSHVRLNIHPDGGIARLRVHGLIAPDQIARAGLACLERLPPRAARDAFLSCCGSARFADRMLEARPFSTSAELFSAAERTWRALEPNDWLEAIAAHPRLGDQPAPKAATEESARWSSAEQATLQAGDPQSLEALRSANRSYEQRFGFVFLLCAAGKSAPEILAVLRARLANDREPELAIAAVEQEQITRLRLEKLLNR